jgi:hypothetical protein
LPIFLLVLVDDPPGESLPYLLLPFKIRFVLPYLAGVLLCHGVRPRREEACSGCAHHLLERALPAGGLLRRLLGQAGILTPIRHTVTVGG